MAKVTGLPAETTDKACAQLRVEAACAGILLADKCASGRVKRQTLEVAATTAQRHALTKEQAVEIDKLDIVAVVKEYVAAGVVLVYDSALVEACSEAGYGTEMPVAVRESGVLCKLHGSVRQRGKAADIVTIGEQPVTLDVEPRDGSGSGIAETLRVKVRALRLTLAEKPVYEAVKERGACKALDDKSEVKELDGVAAAVHDGAGTGEGFRQAGKEVLLLQLRAGEEVVAPRMPLLVLEGATAVGLGFLPCDKAALHLLRAAVLVMLDLYGRAIDAPPRVGITPCVTPDKQRVMAHEAAFLPTLREERGYAGTVVLESAGKVVLKQVVSGEDIVAAGLLNSVICRRDRGEESAHVAGEELVGIKAYTPPVAAGKLIAESAESACTQPDVERSVVAQPRNDLRMREGKSLHRLPCAVGAAVVNDDYLVTPATSICERGSYNVRLVLDNKEAIYLKFCRAHE